MEFVYTPEDYKRKIESETAQKIEQEENNYEERIAKIKNDVGSNPDIKDYMSGGGMIGGAVGLFICCVNCKGDQGLNLDIFVLLIGVGAIIGAIVFGKSCVEYKKAVDKMEYLILEEKEKKDKIITELKMKQNREVLTYKRKFEEEMKRLSIEFEEETKRLSIELANSKLAVEVIEWMTKGYVRTIESADRSAHIKKIDIPFVFKVFEEKITCNFGTYDFEVKRCRNLTSPVERLALAKAIASNIQLNVIMKYPKDISGTDVVIDIEQERNDRYVATTLIYSALNGNYQTVRDWT